VVIGGCSGTQFLATIVPPLPQAATSVVASLKTAKTGLVVWGPGFGSSLTTTGNASCSIGAGPGAGSWTDVQVSAKLAGVASCDPASPDPSQYPLNGKLKLAYALKTLSSQAYVRVTGFDPVPGPDVIGLTGILTKGAGAGSTLSGEVFFDPVVKLLTDPDGAGPIAKGNYAFDNSQILTACGAGGNAIGLVFGGDGPSLLGSVATGLSFTL